MDIKADLKEIIGSKKWSDDNETTGMIEEAYKKGAVEGLKLFAVWRDGKEWVNDMRTLKEAIEYIKTTTNKRG